MLISGKSTREDNMCKEEKNEGKVIYFQAGAEL